MQSTELGTIRYNEEQSIAPPLNTFTKGMIMSEMISLQVKYSKSIWTKFCGHGGEEDQENLNVLFA